MFLNRSSVVGREEVIQGELRFDHPLLEELRELRSYMIRETEALVLLHIRVEAVRLSQVNELDLKQMKVIDEVWNGVVVLSP